MGRSGMFLPRFVSTASALSLRRVATRRTAVFCCCWTCETVWAVASSYLCYVAFCASHPCHCQLFHLRASVWPFGQDLSACPGLSCAHLCPFHRHLDRHHCLSRTICSWSRRRIPTDSNCHWMCTRDPHHSRPPLSRRGKLTQTLRSLPAKRRAH